MKIEDALIWYAVYMELVKKHYLNAIEKEFISIFDTSEILLIKYKPTLRYSQFKKILRKYNSDIAIKFSELKDKLDNEYYAIIAAEVSATNAIYSKMVANFELSNVDVASINNGIIPATGKVAKTSVPTALMTAQLLLLDTVRRVYSNLGSKEDLLRELRASITKSNQGVGTVFSTLVQFVSSSINRDISRTAYNKYIWLSILDSSTTDICRGRNRNVYRYGKGPIPPAHYNCRSRIIPYTSNLGTEYDNITYWLAKQPNDVKPTNEMHTTGITLAQFKLMIKRLLEQENETKE